MAIYNVVELIDRLLDIYQNEGALYADIIQLPEDADSPTRLDFMAVHPNGESVDYEAIDSQSNPSEADFSGYSITPTDPCYNITFSYEDIVTIHHAVRNALEYFKECEKNPIYSTEDLKDIKASSVRCRNLEAKLVKAMKSFT